MKNKISLVLGLTVLSAALFMSSFTHTSSVAKEEAVVNWLDFQEGYDKAVKEKKMIMIDMYTDWCGWCKRMDKATFSDKTVVDKVNANFVAIKFNPEKDGKYMVGQKVMTGHELKLWLGKGKHYGYPTTYFWVAPHQNEEVELSVGYKSPKDFDKLLDGYIKK